MNYDTITTALDDGGNQVRISEAKPGLRYRGATPHHQCCALYPVFRRTKRSSFAHAPDRVGNCSHGESAVHREACSNWMMFFKTQLSGCALCAHRGIAVEEHTICPVVRLEGKCLIPAPVESLFFGKIVWTCRDCLRVHMWDLLDGAARVISNRRVPGINSRVRPDITILDNDDSAVAFLEFRKTHLSSAVRDVASQLNIPLFVIDVESSLDEFQSGLNNPRRGMWSAIDPTDDGYRRTDEFNYRVLEAQTVSGNFSGSSFCVIPSDDGEVSDVVFHAVGKSDALPDPAIGKYLVAAESSLGCESQKRWMGPPSITGLDDDASRWIPASLQL